MAAKKTSSATATKATKAASKRHYDQQALEQDYQQTFDLSLQVTLWSSLGILLFFGLMIVGLTFWHTPHDDFVRDFGDRVDTMYDGLKLTDPKPVKEKH
jgi:hypothetical protein